MNRSYKVMQGDIRIACLFITALAVESVCSIVVCEHGKSWWNRELGECVPCTRCEPSRHLAVKYPCQVHRDAVCHSIHDIQIYPFNKPKTQNDSEKSDIYNDYEYADSDVDTSSDEADWDERMSSLTIAMVWCSACIVFFVLVLCWSLYHAKQWRVIKQAIKSDVRNLSAKLILMDSINEVPAEAIIHTDHHLYCNIHVGKDELLGPISKKGLGNVYTQEKH